MWRSVVAGAVAAALAAWAASLSAQVPPDETWRTLRTEHFRVTFPEGLEALGRRTADHAERALGRLADAFIEPPESVVDILLTDNVDVSNGFAQILPSDRITIYARPPVDELGLGFFDSWLELVVTHELAHVLHLDRTVNPLGELGRILFGRSPVGWPVVGWPVFTTLDAPRWSVEGIATWYESRLTGSGRVHGTFHDMILRTAILEGRFAGIDQAGGESPVWPAGTRAYAYGSLFFDHLLERHGEERMADFVVAAAGQWIPYRLNAAARRAFGASFSEEWRTWEEALRAEHEELEDELARVGPVTRPEALTRGARQALYARVSPDGRSVAFVRSDGRSDTQVRVLDAGGGDGRQLARINGFGTVDWTPNGGLLVSQLEFADPYRLYGDLYVLAADGSARRLSHGERLGHPSVAPDGSWAVAVREGGGTQGLVRVALGTGEVTPLVAPDPDVHWAFPRVSPDGAWIAASRWTAGAHLDVVVLDVAGQVVLEVTRDRAMDLAPAWSPDGRWLVWGSDRTGIPNVLAAEVDPARGTAGAPVMITNVTTGAAYPAVDPAGGWVYFSGYHADGWELERAPFDPGSAPVAPAPAARFRTESPYTPPPPVTEGTTARPYSALPTLRPYYWEPVVEESILAPEFLGPAFGGQTSGIDLVGRHAYGVRATYRPGGRKMEGGLAYDFAGLGNPVLSIGVSQVWGYGGLASAAGVSEPLHVRERERSVLAGVTFERRRWRRRVGLTLSGGTDRTHGELLDAAFEPSNLRLRRPDHRFADLRATLAISTARSHAFQMGVADGVSAVVRGRIRNELSVPDSLVGVIGGDQSFDEVLGRVSAYRTLGGPGYAAHVLALRGAAGRAWGPHAHAGHFSVGGASGSPETITGLTLFGGSGLTFPVRGYAQGTRSGRTAWSATAEYRFPIALMDQGIGAWPVHADRVVGGLFLDAGNAWGPELGVSGYDSPMRSALASVGAEVTVETFLFWSDFLRLRGGVAHALTAGPHERFYVRVGLSF